MIGYKKIEEMSSTFNTIKKLKRLNIDISNDLDVGLTHKNGSESIIELVKDKKKTNPFFFGVSTWQYCVLALAITQEVQNNYIEQDDIDFVNFVFSFKRKITNDDVQEFNKKYI